MRNAIAKAKGSVGMPDLQAVIEAWVLEFNDGTLYMRNTLTGATMSVAAYQRWKATGRLLSAF